MDSTWVPFEAGNEGLKVSSQHRREVRSAAARASHQTRRANKKAGGTAKQRQETPAAAVVPSEQCEKEAEGSEKQHQEVIATAVPNEKATTNEIAAKVELKPPTWTQIVTSPRLHAVCLFVISTYTNLRGVHGRAGPNTSCCLFMRGQALRAMQKNTGLEAQNMHLAECLAILAGWEKVYGEDEFYAAHIKVLRTLEAQEGDEEKQEDSDRAEQLMHSVWPTVIKQSETVKTLISSDGQLKLDEGAEFITMASREGKTPAGLAPKVFDHARPETRLLLFLLKCLVEFDAANPNVWTNLFQLTLLVFAWHTEGTLPANWSNLTHPEDFEDLALYHVRAAMLSVLGAWTKLINDGHQHEGGYFRASDSMDEHYLQLAALESDELLGTQYEEAALWSLFIITSTATAELWKSRTLDVIRRLLTNLEIDNWEQLETLLQQFVYRERLHKRNCRALYETVTKGIPPDKDIGLRSLEITFADLFL